MRDAVIVEQVEPLPLKGKAELVPAYLLIGVSGQDDGYSRRLDLPIVGREDELGDLHEAFHRVGRAEPLPHRDGLRSGGGGEVRASSRSSSNA